MGDLDWLGDKTPWSPDNAKIEELEQALAAERERVATIAKALGTKPDKVVERARALGLLSPPQRTYEDVCDSVTRVIDARAEAWKDRDAAIERAERVEGDNGALKQSLQAMEGTKDAWHRDEMRARARAEAAEAWQRAVAKELGWCEELGEAIPDAEFMANIARTHGESHMRLEGAEAEVERLRSGSRLYETVLELEAEVERLRGEWDHYKRIANDCALEAGSEQDRADAAETRITKALGILEGAVKAPWNRQTLSEAARGVLHDAIAALKGEDTP
jgi:hypothetical protein